jgi:NADPH-dependent curcumin reductase CurA
MTNGINLQIRLAGRPVGLPKRSDWQFTETPIRELRDGEVLTRVLYLSLDPAMRGWMNEGKSYIAPVGIGDVMRAGAVGKVVASKHPKFAANDYVSGGFGVQEYAALDGAQLTKIDPRLAPLPTFLNALGMPGMTAYFGLLDVGDPKEGDTVVVSAASGAVGATVGQIANMNCAVAPSNRRNRFEIIPTASIRRQPLQIVWRNTPCRFVALDSRPN